MPDRRVEPLPSAHPVLEGCHVAHLAPGTSRIIPEAGLSALLFELRYLSFRTVDVKDAPLARRAWRQVSAADRESLPSFPPDSLHQRRRAPVAILVLLAA